MILLKMVRIVGFVEAISAINLFFLAMPLKYLVDMPKAVKWTGSIHGVLWLAYAVVVFVALLRGTISGKWFWILAFASLIPFGPFVVDGRLSRASRGRESPDSAVK